jgi:hypothetical protein
VCLTCIGGHSFSNSMNTHEPFVRFDVLLDSFSCGLGRVHLHAYRASFLVHDCDTPSVTIAAILSEQ